MPVTRYLAPLRRMARERSVAPLAQSGAGGGPSLKGEGPSLPRLDLDGDAAVDVLVRGRPEPAVILNNNGGASVDGRWAARGCWGRGYHWMPVGMFEGSGPT